MLQFKEFLIFCMASLPIRTLVDIYVATGSSNQGLSAAEAAKRLHAQGKNEVVGHQVSPLAILLRQARSPFVYLLAVAALVSFVLGEVADGVLVLLFIGINAILAFVQEYRSERSLKALQKFVVPNARVVRDGKEITIPAVEVVVGDVVVVATGDAVPADVRWLAAQALQIDESVLTGESVPIEKRSDAVLPSGVEEALVRGYASTIVIQGEGRGVVVATGKQTEFGSISQITLTTSHASGFEQGLATFSQAIIKLMIGIVVLLFIINLAIKGLHINIVELALFSIALAVTVVPEALPVVTTVAFSRGALKLAKNQVVVKRLSAVEDLGSIEVLCTDKTGTITENKLSVSQVVATDSAACLLWGTLVSTLTPHRERESSSSFDEALLNYATTKKVSIPSARLISHIPFDPERRRMSMFVEVGGKRYIVARGAPEELSRVCALSPDEQEQLMHGITKAGRKGDRTLGIAYKAVAASKKTHTIQDESNLAWLGMVSFKDPVKPTAKAALAEAHRLGVAVKILTGDHADVARSVAQAVGLITSAEEIITGEEFEALTPAAQQKAVLKYHVFARVNPKQKFQIIQRLQEHGKEVGFLGEGINDAPALKMAEVGIVVSNASDLAREAADIVLLNPGLNVIIDGIRQGREVFENVVKYIKITLIGNFGNFFTLAMVSLILPYVPLLPLQILLLNILTDFPLIAIATDQIDGVDLRRPRAYNLREIVVVATLLGLVSSVFDFALFGLFVHAGPVVLRTAWFLTSAAAEFVLIFLIRSRRSVFKAGLPSITILGLVMVAIILTIGCVVWLPLRNIFSFTALPVIAIVQIIVLTLGYAIATEVAKCLYYRHAHRHVQ